MNLLKYLIPFLLLFANKASSQKIYSGFYFEEWKYRPEDNDTFKYAAYEDGTIHLNEDKDHISIINYKDVKNKIIDCEYYISRENWDGDYDSLKLMYFYHGNTNYKTVQLEKYAFKTYGGCFAWKTNKYCYVWYQTGYCTYEYDNHGNCTQQINRLDYWGDTTLLVYNTEYEYDETGRITKMKSVSNGKPSHTFAYSYAPNYKKTEEYNDKSELRERKEEFFNGNLLIKEIVYNSYSKTTIELHYRYDTLNRRTIMERFNIRDNSKDQTSTRNYYYID